MSFIKIDINNFESIYVRCDNIEMFRKVKAPVYATDPPGPETYNVIMGMASGEDYLIMQKAEEETANKLIEGLLDEMHGPPMDYLENLPHYQYRDDGMCGEFPNEPCC